ncbi:MAG TPA: hypothetical protein VML19_04535 [Verrucomicrobiae bacterium]|nr:hypothetical protein [Verrucomicrobiae bacterium]
MSNRLVTFHCRNRSSLPLAHTLIDLALLAFWIWHAAVVLNPLTTRLKRTQPNALAAYASMESIGWDPEVYSTPDRHFALMLTGTLPAGVVSYAIRPEAGWQTNRRLWDPVWLLIHEAVAIPFWFLAGMWLDTGRSRLARLLRGYVLLRVIVAALAMLLPAHNWWIPQFLFWLGLAGYGLLRALHGVMAMASGRRSLSFVGRRG